MGKYREQPCERSIIVNLVEKRHDVEPSGGHVWGCLGTAGTRIADFIVRSKHHFRAEMMQGELKIG